MKVSVQDFFQEFYESQVFHPVVAGQDLKWFVIDSAYDSTVEIEQLFSSVDRNIFRKEMLAVRMEMVGLAFTHNIKSGERLLNQSLFTKDYLYKNGESEIWDIMGEYNQSIAMSSTDIAKGERAQRAVTASANFIRAKLAKEYMKKYYKEGMDITFMTRVINRENCEVAWKNRVTLKYLTSRFADRVGCNKDISTDALMGIAFVILEFYQVAKDAIKSVKFE